MLHCISHRIVPSPCRVRICLYCVHVHIALVYMEELVVDAAEIMDKEMGTVICWAHTRLSECTSIYTSVRMLGFGGLRVGGGGWLWGGDRKITRFKMGVYFSFCSLKRLANGTRNMAASRVIEDARGPRNHTTIRAKPTANSSFEQAVIQADPR